MTNATEELWPDEGSAYRTPGRSLDDDDTHDSDVDDTVERVISHAEQERFDYLIAPILGLITLSLYVAAVSCVIVTLAHAFPETMAWQVALTITVSLTLFLPLVFRDTDEEETDG